MNKLLDKSFRIFLGYAAIVLACSIPAYYAIVDYIWRHELKEHNQIVATGIKQNLHALQLSDSALQAGVQLWNILQPEMGLVRVDRLQRDSTYNIYRIHKYAAREHPTEDRFQGLVTYVDLAGRPYRLTVETNMEESHETILGLTLVAVIFFVLLLTGLIILNRRMSARIWQPFYSSLEKIRDFDLNHHQTIVFEKTKILEFETLNTSLDMLISGNVAAYHQQKHFIENASHELQTPLAIVQSKLDVFLQDSALTDKQSEMIEQAQHALSRMIRISKNLLLLARIENSQFPETEVLSMSALLDHNLSLILPLAAETQVRIISVIPPGIFIRANKTLAEILLFNLLLNAVRHSPESGMVHVALSPDHLRISNTGLVSLQREHLFKRFGRVSSQAPVTGLGLAIVQQICNQYGWEVSYDFSAESHHFTVRFT